MNRSLSFLIGFVLLLGLLSVLFYQNVSLDPEVLATQVSSYGILAPIVFVLVLTFAIIVSQIPNIPVAFAGGALFGTQLASVLLFISGVLGSTACFYIARFFRSYFLKKVGSNYSFLQSSSPKKIAWIIFVSRLFPFLPFDIISYGAGLTTIRYYQFITATTLGMIPMILVFAYTGSMLVKGAVWPYVGLGIILVLTVVVPLLFKKQVKEWMK